MEFRHEWKIEINRADFLVLSQRLSAIMRPDEHGCEGEYKIRSAVSLPSRRSAAFSKYAACRAYF